MAAPAGGEAVGHQRRARGNMRSNSHVIGIVACALLIPWIAAAQAPRRPGPQDQRWKERLNTPLSGEKWKLDGVPLSDVLVSLSSALDADVTFDGPDGSTPVTEDLRGRLPMDAFKRLQTAAGYSVAEATTRVNPATGRAEIRVQGRKTPEGQQPTTPAQSYRPGTPGLTLPKVITEAKPSYTRAAMQAKIQGSVQISGVVGVDGTLGDMKVVKSLSPDLDREAIRAAQKWRFVPGARDGKPVPVEVSLELMFKLK
jgi:TonB family protein